MLFSAPSERFYSLYAKRNFIYGKAVTSLEAHHLHDAQHRSFVPRGGNDVELTLK